MHRSLIQESMKHAARIMVNKQTGGFLRCWTGFALSSSPHRSLQDSFLRTFATTNATEPIEKAAKSAGASFIKFVKDNLNITITAGIGLVAINWVTPILYTRYYESNVLRKLTNGVLQADSYIETLPIPRTELRNQIRALLVPEYPTRFYSLIFGESGVGKTALVQAACGELQGGVGYLECVPSTEDFGRDLGETFGFQLEKHVNLFNIVTQTVVGRKTVELPQGSGHLASLRRSAEALHRAASEYKARTGRPFTLVIDSLERLMKGDEDVLEAFLEYAKIWAVDGTISCVFVTNTWEAALLVMGKHPAQSRAGTPLIIGDLRRSEAIDLLNYYDVQGSIAEEITDLVGGSLPLLERAAGLLHGGLKFEQIKEKLINLMALEFESIGGVTTSRSVGNSKDGKAFDAKVEETKTALESTIKSVTTANEMRIKMEEWIKHVPNLHTRKTLLAGPLLKTDGETVFFKNRLAQETASRVLKSL